MSAEDIGSLAGRVEFEDRTSATMDLVLDKVEKLEARFGGLDHSVKTTAEGFLIAEVAIKAVQKAFDLTIDLVKDFTTEGAKIADVEENFTRLNASAGRLGSTLLGELKSGTHNTITDFELMKVANQDLTAGMKLTDAQFGTLAKGAFALAQATGTDVKTALDTMNDAMLTGRTRSVAMLTGKIDLTKAENDFADKLGTTADKLTAEGKLEADRAAILDSVTQATARLGEQTDGLDEMVDQARTSFKNFYEDLIKGAATSPHVIGAFTAIKDAVLNAFGGDSDTILQNFLGVINSVADTVAEYTPQIIGGFKSMKDWAVAFFDGAVEAWHTFGPTIVDGLTTVRDWILAVYHGVVDTWDALPQWLKTVAEHSAITAGGLVLLSQGAGAASNAVGELIGYAGNLTTTFSGLPIALANVGGAIARVGVWIKVLDFTSVVDAIASFKLLGGAISSTLGPLGMATLYAGALYAAFELGKWQPVSDFFQNLGLKIMGYSEAERQAMIATDHATQEALKNAKATGEQTDTAAQLKKVMDGIKTAMDGAAASTKVEGDQLDRSKLVMTSTTEEAKKYKEAWDDLAKVGTKAEDVLKDVTAAMQASINKYLDAGVAIDKLKIAYKLTDEQASALNEKWKEHAKVAKDMAEAWKKLNELGENHRNILAGIGDKVKEDILRYHDLGASVGDLAKAYKLTETQIQAIIDARDKEKAATDKQNASYKQQNELLDATKIKVKTLSGEFITLAEAQERHSAGGSSEVNRGNLDEYARYWKIPEGVAIEAAKKGFSFQEILQAWQSNSVDSWVPHGPRIPGFKQGGVGDFGEGTLAVLHGKEAIVPLDRAEGLGEIHLNFYVNGTGKDVAKQASEELMRQMKLRRQFGAR